MSLSGPLQIQSPRACSLNGPGLGREGFGPLVFCFTSGAAIRSDEEAGNDWSDPESAPDGNDHSAHVFSASHHNCANRFRFRSHLDGAISLLDFNEVSAGQTLRGGLDPFRRPVCYLSFSAESCEPVPSERLDTSAQRASEATRQSLAQRRSN